MIKLTDKYENLPKDHDWNYDLVVFVQCKKCGATVYSKEDKWVLINGLNQMPVPNSCDEYSMDEAFK